MKEKSPALRIHVIGFGGKEEEIKPLHAGVKEACDKLWESLRQR